MKTKIIAIIMIINVGCYSFKTITFKSDTFLSAGKEEKFTMKIPKGCKLLSSDIQQYILREYEYIDSSVLYISVDITYANSPNEKNWLKCSRPLERYKCEEGKQDNGKYWKEKLINGLVIGYYNVPESELEKFDKAISTLIKIK